MCDLYCYESDAGFETHVANSRQRAWLRALYYLTDTRVTMCGETHRFSKHWANRVNWSLPHWFTHYKIGLPQDGKCFCDETEDEMFGRIIELSDAGYCVPEHLKQEAMKAINP